MTSQPSNSSGPSTSAPSGAGGRLAPDPAALDRLLAAGPLTVYIETERTTPGADPNRPAFLQGLFCHESIPNLWFNSVLPHVQTLTLNIASTSDIQFAGAMLGSQAHPQLHLAFRTLELPGFHWFSGVQHNRLHNPYMQLAAHLTNLQSLSFTLHTAGLTTSAWNERHMIELETTDPEKAKERRCIPPHEVAVKYELGALSRCRALQQIRIDYIDCDMTRNFCRTGDPVHVLQAIRAYLAQNFANQGQQVLVQLHRIQ